MTLLVVGVSHRTAPVSLLDRIALVESSAERLQLDLYASPHVAEAMVLATCNRVEIYAEVSKFHGAVVDVTETLAKVTGVAREEITPHLYVRYEDRAAHHLFSVASGLDSMVVGEQQILGQVRNSLRLAQETATIGRSLNDLAQTALRVGKRVQNDTGIDRAGLSIASVALDLAAGSFDGSLAGRRAVVIGAGAMSSLAATLLARAGADIVVANRTLENAQRLAEQLAGRAVPLSALADELAQADLVVTCTGATGLVVTTESLALARMGTDRPLVVVDLALPHDTEESIADLPGVSRIDLASLIDLPGARASEASVELARSIVNDEVRTYLASIAAQRVEPIVVSLRARADEVVDAEIARLRLRLPALDDEAAQEMARALRRAVSTLLHTPTVRMKELAGDPDGTRYAAALHRLFDLDPAAIAELTTTAELATDMPNNALDEDASYDEMLRGLS